MLLTDSLTAVERLKFFKGQRLFADDLQALEDFNRDMRWLHNRSLHQVGIASGYAITGNKGDREVTIGPGYAIDSRGREIVLTEARVLQVPPVANDGSGSPAFYDLTIRFDVAPKDRETRDGVCVARDAIRLADEPIFCWIALGPGTDGAGAPTSNGREAVQESQRQEFEAGVLIRIARVEVLNCRLNSKVSIAERTNAKPPMQRFVAAGGDRLDQQGKFERTWRRPPEKAPRDGLMIETTVVTRAAGFQAVPKYTAQIIGNRQFEATVDGVKVPLLVDGFVRVVFEPAPQAASDELKNRVPTRDSFIASVLIPNVLVDTNVDLGKLADALPAAVHGVWGLEWFGIEE
jgi:hypothetical protein